MTTIEQDRAYRRKYNHSEKNKVVQKRWAQTENGKASLKRARDKYHAKWNGTEKYKRACSSYELKTHYGITLEDYEKRLVHQYGGCAICGRTPEEEGRRLNIDHNHRTGIVRGLLCSKCNRGLSNFQDNTELLNLAIDYLKIEEV